MGVLPASLQLKGKNNGGTNQLYWQNSNEKNVTHYMVERKLGNEADFTVIGSVPLSYGNNYVFEDNNFNSGTIQYRLRIVYNNKTKYSNIVMLRAKSSEIVVYPNPVKNTFSISIGSGGPADYKLELISTSGQLQFVAEVKNIASSTLTYPRNSNIKPGIYLLRVTNKTTGKAEIRKLVFE
jgi:hypothetical protein